MNRALARGARGRAGASDGASSLHRRELVVCSAVHAPVVVSSHALDSGSSGRASSSACSSSNLFAGVNRRAVRRSMSGARVVSASLAASAAAAPAAAAAMKTVTVDLGDRSYPIYIGPGLLERGELLRQHIPGKRVLIVTNETVAPLYLDK